jgi:hypothetical protein
MKKVIYTLFVLLPVYNASAQLANASNSYIPEGSVAVLKQNTVERDKAVRTTQVSYANNGNSFVKQSGTEVAEAIFSEDVNQKKSEGSSMTESDSENHFGLSFLSENQLINDVQMTAFLRGLPTISIENTSFFSPEFIEEINATTKNYTIKEADEISNKGLWVTEINIETVSRNNELELASNNAQSRLDYPNKIDYWVLKSDIEGREMDIVLVDYALSSVDESMIVSAENYGVSEEVKFISGVNKRTKKTIGVWPNPTQGEFNLALTGMKDDDNISVDVINQDGRIILRMDGKVSELRKVYTLPEDIKSTELTVRLTNEYNMLTEKFMLNRVETCSGDEELTADADLADN